jgi:hypothetical protein
LVGAVAARSSVAARLGMKFPSLKAVSSYTPIRRKSKHVTAKPTAA